MWRLVDNATTNGDKVSVGKGYGLGKCGTRKYGMDVIEVVGKGKVEMQSWDFR